MVEQTHKRYTILVAFERCQYLFWLLASLAIFAALTVLLRWQRDLLLDVKFLWLSLHFHQINHYHVN